MMRKEEDTLGRRSTESKRNVSSGNSTASQSSKSRSSATNPSDLTMERTVPVAAPPGTELRRNPARTKAASLALGGGRDGAGRRGRRMERKAARAEAASGSWAEEESRRAVMAAAK